MTSRAFEKVGEEVRGTSTEGGLHVKHQRSDGFVTVFYDCEYCDRESI